MSEAPSNIQEFNTIAGLIFAQLYRAFPVLVDIDRPGIATAMGVVGDDWSKHKLPSGRSFSDMLAYTISWLTAEEYTRAAGGHPAERVTLTSKGLAAMSAIPSGLKQTLGTELSKATEQGSTSNLAGIGDLIGGFFGGFTKSMSSG
jgi:hypothetical protein